MSSSLEDILKDALDLSGAEAVFVNDRDGVLIGRADDAAAAIDLDPWFSTTFINALDQANKLELGEPIFAVSDFDNVTVVQYSLLPLIVSFYLKPDGNVGLVHALSSRLQTRLQPIRNRLSAS